MLGGHFSGRGERIFLRRQIFWGWQFHWGSFLGKQFSRGKNFPGKFSRGGVGVQYSEVGGGSFPDPVFPITAKENQYKDSYAEQYKFVLNFLLLQGK